jgi:2-polyprenyl-6-methoxyphenol hydroxylase-like FAD-dependent oxidoreductase
MACKCWRANWPAPSAWAATWAPWRRCWPTNAEHRRVTLPIYMGTNAIVQLFTDDRAPARVLRGTVLGVARRLPPLRAMISRQLTGGAAQQA